MKLMYLIAGFVAGVIFTFFAGLLTELIVLAVIAGIVFYVWRKRWGQEEDTPSMTKPSP